MKTFVRTDQYSCRFFPFLFLHFERIILISFWVIFTANLSHPQNFLLTDIYSEQFSIDRIAQQVYFKDFYSDTVRRIDLKTLEVTNTSMLVLLPIFSNKLHVMVHGSNSWFDPKNPNNYILYNLDNQSKFIITDTLGYPPNVENYYSFSPNDINFMTIGGIHYFSLEDSLLHPIDKNVQINYSRIDAYPQWSSDTSFVFLSGDDVIAEYFLKSKRLDTLVTVNHNIVGFAYNIKNHTLAYSTYEHPPRIYLHRKGSTQDTLIFLPTRDDPNCQYWALGQYGLTSLCWSPENEKLAFLAFQYVDIPIAGIYIYSPDSNRTYAAASICDVESDGRKYHLKWANNDTLVYVNSTNGHIYGWDVSNVITSIDKKNDEQVPINFTIANYPNPFNGTTKISVTLPNGSNGALLIYDTIGRLIKKYYLDKREQNKYEILWNGINENNKYVSSGVYLGVLKSDDSKTQSTKTIKMIYLK